jgi:ankyrin repeat protein
MSDEMDMDYEHRMIYKYCRENNTQALSESIKSCPVDLLNKPVYLFEDEFYSLLHIAVQYKSLECLKILLENGADVDARDYNGATPLGQAVIQDSLECLEILLKYKPDVNAQDDIGRSPLYMAIEEGSEECLPRLLMIEDVDVNLPAGWSAQTPLHKAAAMNRNRDAIILLLERGADHTLLNRSGNTFLVFIQDKDLKKEIEEYIENMKLYGIKTPDE